MKKVLIFLALLSFSFALYPGSITVVPIEYKNFGDEDLPAFNITLEVDCLEGTIDQYTESSNTPVPGATGYLKYVQYQVPLMSTKSTDSSGHAVHQLPGIISYYTGLFTLTIEKAGYRKQEIHFDISGCFVNVTGPPPLPDTGNGQPPPEPGCKTDDDCLSSEICNTVLGKCEKISGSCGYAYHHQWIGYECCSDADCGSGKYCDTLSKECRVVSAEINETEDSSQTNITGNGQPDTGNGEAPVCPLGFAGLVFSVLVVLAIRN